MDIPFAARVLVLLLLAGVLSAIDFHKNGRRSTGYREYGFIFLTGLLGAIVGGANDAITSFLSSEYFVIGKGLTEGSGLRLESVEYGAQVGFSGGVISGAIVIYMSRRKSGSPPAEFNYLLRRLWIPLTGAISGGVVLPLAASKFDPFDIADKLQPIISRERISHFLFVWWMHAGLYAGLLAGLCLFLALVIRRRRFLNESGAILP